MVCKADGNDLAQVSGADQENLIRKTDAGRYIEVILDDKLGSNTQHDLTTPVKDHIAVSVDHGMTESAKSHHHEDEAAQKNSVWLLLYCFLGIMVSFSLNGLVLEKITNHRVLGELSLTFVFCLFYSMVAYALHVFTKEKPSTVPKSKLAIIGFLAFGSTISSMVALRYVTFITRILGKSCKSIPVMVVGVFLGKRYALKKYLSITILSVGVAIFLVGTAHEKQARAAQSNEIHAHQSHGKTPNLFLGMGLLLISLMLDGATGALEDKYLEQYHIGAFDLMYMVNIWKSAFAAIGMVVAGELPTFMEQLVPSTPNLLILSATGALGQAFIFFTISKFGALTTSIIGTSRKVLSIVLSVVIFGHILSMEQFLGLGLAFFGIASNWIKFQSCRPCGGPRLVRTTSEVIILEEEKDLLDSQEDTADSEDDEEFSDAQRALLADMKAEEEVMHPKELERGLELVNIWHRTHHSAHGEDIEAQSAPVASAV